MSENGAAPDAGEPGWRLRFDEAGLQDLAGELGFDLPGIPLRPSAPDAGTVPGISFGALDGIGDDALDLARQVAHLLPGLPVDGTPSTVPSVEDLPEALRDPSRLLRLLPAIEPVTLPTMTGRSPGSGGPMMRSLGPLRPAHPELGGFDPYVVRRDFPALQQDVNGQPIVWLDNAATTQKPQAVIDALAHYYAHDNSNVHRGAHALAARATDAYEWGRSQVRKLLNAEDDSEIVFVRGTTEGINLIANTWGRRVVSDGDLILVSELEHHSNIVPWQMLAAQTGATLKPIPIDDRGDLRMDAFETMLTPRVKIVSLSQVSNALGTVLPVEEVARMGRRVGATVVIDGAQGVPHLAVDVRQLGADFYVFSGHKLFGPTGIGAVYGRRELLEDMPPWQGGGSMIKHVAFDRIDYADVPAKFEAGTPNVAGAYGLGAAIDYLDGLDLDAARDYERRLLQYMRSRLREVPGTQLIGTAEDMAGVQSLLLDGVSVEDAGRELDRRGIAVRAGHHCAQPALAHYGLDATIRPSIAFYNTPEDVDRLIDALEDIGRAAQARGGLGAAPAPPQRREAHYRRWT